MPPQTQTPFARFFRSVEGKLVARYGSATPSSANVLIGAARDADGRVTWDTDAVTAITQVEAERFSREYDRSVREGALVELKEADYLAYRERVRKRKEAATPAPAPAPEATPAAAPGEQLPPAGMLPAAAPTPPTDDTTTTTADTPSDGGAAAPPAKE